MINCKISNIEFVLPSVLLDNNFFKANHPEYNFNKFEKNVGIKSRHVCADNESTLTLAINAINKLINKNNIDKNNIDFLILCTQSPEYMLPTTSCIIQERCGLPNSMGAFDINLGCSGYTYGLSIAKAMIGSGQAKNVILVTSETYSKYINKKDLINSLLFGDAATATLISKSEYNGIENFIFGTDGSGYDKLIVKNNFFNKAKTSPEKTYSNFNVYTDNNLYMDGPEVFNFTLGKIPILVEEVYKKNKTNNEAISKYIFHQANMMLLEFVRRKAKIDKSKMFYSLSNTGNTVSNTIPIALKEYSKIRPNNDEKIVLAGFGVGLSWCGGIINLKNKI